MDGRERHAVGGVVAARAGERTDDPGGCRSQIPMPAGVGHERTGSCCTAHLLPSGSLKNTNEPQS